MKFDTRKDVTKLYGVLWSLKFTDLLILQLLNFTEKLELKFALKDEIWAVIFLKDMGCYL